MYYSVVIPTYNNESTIERAIKSVINQTRFELIKEIIVVDDGSSDCSGDLIRNMQAQYKIIKYIKKKNGGAASARNKGIEEASSDFIALLDADDEWKENKIEIQNRIIESHREVLALGSNRESEVISFGKRVFGNVYQVTPLLYCIKNWPCTPSMVFDSRIFGNEPCFPEDMSHAEEGLFFLKIAKKAGLYYVKDDLVKCGDGKRAFGISGLSGDLKKMHQGVLDMMKKACDLGIINRLWLPFLFLLEDVKYIRRILIDKIK